MSEPLRIWTAIRLAKDLDTCEALLRGERVDPARLDPQGLEWARRLRFVNLDTAAIDLFAAETGELEEAA